MADIAQSTRFVPTTTTSVDWVPATADVVLDEELDQVSETVLSSKVDDIL